MPARNTRKKVVEIQSVYLAHWKDCLPMHVDIHHGVMEASLLKEWIGLYLSSYRFLSLKDLFWLVVITFLNLHEGKLCGCYGS
jgi:hypothetical protein